MFAHISQTSGGKEHFCGSLPHTVSSLSLPLQQVCGTSARVSLRRNTCAVKADEFVWVDASIAVLHREGRKLTCAFTTLLSFNTQVTYIRAWSPATFRCLQYTLKSHIHTFSSLLFFYRKTVFIDLAIIGVNVLEIL